jgi:hypothetical protein
MIDVASFSVANGTCETTLEDILWQNTWKTNVHAFFRYIISSIFIHIA